MHQPTDPRLRDDPTPQPGAEQELARLRQSLARAEQRVAELEARLRQEQGAAAVRDFADALPLLIGTVGPDEKYEFVNKSYEQWFGRPRTELVGRSVREVLGEDVYGARVEQLGAAMRGERQSFEIVTQRPDGSRRFTETEYLPRRGPDGAPDGFYVLVTDATERRSRDEAVRASEARLRLALDAGRMAVWEVDLPTDSLVVSPELCRLFGLPEEGATTLHDIRARYFPGERERLQAVAREALERGERFAEAELRIIRADGELRWLMLRAELHLDAAGAPSRYVGVVFDATEQKRAEQHKNLLVNELNHRVKNTLATVQAIVGQALRTSQTPQHARAAIESRLIALSRVHDVLTRQSWEGAALAEVMAQAAAPFATAESERIEISGPDVWLPPKVALALAMAAQELFTNAVKYGALSNTAGRVRLKWSADEARPHLSLRWEESGGPLVVPPHYRGLGSRLLERGVAGEFQGEVRLQFLPTGVICEMEVPLC